MGSATKREAHGERGKRAQGKGKMVRWVSKSKMASCLNAMMRRSMGTLLHCKTIFQPS